MESFEKAVEELLTRQRVGSGLPSPNWASWLPGKATRLVNDFLEKPQENHQKKARSMDGYNTLL
jgi:hypothetical protein